MDNFNQIDYGSTAAQSAAFPSAPAADFYAGSYAAPQPQYAPAAPAAAAPRDKKNKKHKAEPAPATVPFEPTAGTSAIETAAATAPVAQAPVSPYGGGYFVDEYGYSYPAAPTQAPVETAPSGAKEQTYHARRPKTTHDYQPRKADVDASIKYKKRVRNIFAGILTFLSSALVLIPYILSAVNVDLSALPLNFNFIEFNFIGQIKIFAQSGGVVPITYLIPSFIVAFGLLFIVINMLVSLVAIFGAVQPKKYVVTSLFYLLALLAVVIMMLVGVPQLGVAKVEQPIMLIADFKNSEVLAVIALALVNILITAFCASFCPKDTGYTGKYFNRRK